MASDRQRPENQKENQAGHSPERTVEGQWKVPLGVSLKFQNQRSRVSCGFICRAYPTPNPPQAGQNKTNDRNCLQGNRELELSLRFFFENGDGANQNHRQKGRQGGGETRGADKPHAATRVTLRRKTNPLPGDDSGGARWRGGTAAISRATSRARVSRLLLLSSAVRD